MLLGAGATRKSGYLSDLTCRQAGHDYRSRESCRQECSAGTMTLFVFEVLNHLESTSD